MSSSSDLKHSLKNSLLKSLLLTKRLSIECSDKENIEPIDSIEKNILNSLNFIEEIQDE